MSRRNNKGFTLIELIIAMSILSIVLLMGYNVINKSDFFMNSQQKITNNQSIANIVNTYLAQDIEESTSISAKSQLENSKYNYIISKNSGSIKYEVTLYKKKNKDVYSLSRIDGTSSIEIVTDQLRSNDTPIIIKSIDNETYEVKISYMENDKAKEYKFSISSRIGINRDDSNEENVPDIIKPGVDDIPKLPEEMGPNTHYIGFWMADSNVQKENNIYTWIDSNFNKGSSNQSKNTIRADISPGYDNKNEFTSINSTKVSGSITPKSKVQKMSIYVSKGTKIEDFQIKNGQNDASIIVSESRNIDNKLELSGGSNGGKWYTCQINGDIDTFKVESGQLSIDKSIVKSGFILIVYGEVADESGDADIIIEFNRESGQTNSNQFILRNRIKFKNINNRYETLREYYDPYFDSSVQINLLNFTHETPPNINILLEKLGDTRIYNIQGYDFYDKNNSIKTAVLTLEGNIYIQNTSGMSEILHRKKYEIKFASQNDRFDNRIVISGLKEGETGLLKINFKR